MPQNISEDIIKTTDDALDEIQSFASAAESEIEKTVAPVRAGIAKRFPVLFLLAVTFGFTATVVGIEQILVQHEILQSNPWLILSLGIGILIATGTIYKKLG